MHYMSQQKYVFPTLFGLFVEVSVSQWLFCGLRSVCHLAPWSKVITVSIAPSDRTTEPKSCDIFFKSH